MAYSENFPAQRPIFSLDAANAGRLDPRMTFTRASTANVWDGSKHLSSENILIQSSDFNTTWINQGLTSITGGQTDPSGGTSGFTLLEDSAAAFHRVYQSVTADGEIALTVYAKRNAGSRYLNLTIATAISGGSALATFDLAGGATHTSNGASSTLTNLSATQTASGNGYYKCVFKATGSGVTGAHISLSNVATPAAGSFGLVYYTGDGTSSIDVAFASLSTTGATDYNATTTQIHREYAPSLVSKSNNAARFDHSTDGQSMGVLIEGQAQNLLPYSVGTSSWTLSQASRTSAAAIAPDGTQQAVLITWNGSSGSGYAFPSLGTVTSGTVYTGSVYVKAVGSSSIMQLTLNAPAFASDNAVNFTLTGDGSVGSSFGGATGAISSIGNGWYRVSITATAASSSSACPIVVPITSTTDARLPSFTSNGYDGLLCWGFQLEANSFPSSLISTSGSAATRAAESLSVATADIPGFSEGAGTVVYETGGVASATAANQLAWSLFSSTTANSYTMAGVNVNGPTDTSVRVYVRTPDGAQAFFNTGTVAVGDSYKMACRYELDNVAASLNGGAIVSDTSGTVPVGIDTLWIGQRDGANHLNSNIKRIALYNEALSDTNLQALTS